MPLIVAVALIVLYPSSLVRIDQAVLADPVLDPSRSFEEDLYNSSMFASGVKLCDEHRRLHQMAAFKRMYGKRIGKLRRSYLKWHGPDKGNLITVSDCYDSKSVIGSDQRLHIELEQFNDKLIYLEKKYGDKSSYFNGRF